MYTGLEGHENTRKQGDVGLGVAIGWFVSQGYTTCIPLTDNQPYDVVIEIDNKLRKIQVKTTRYKAPSDRYIVLLRSIRPNRTGNIIRLFDPNVVDFVFVLTGNGDQYFIPSKHITQRNTMTLTPKLDKYKVS